MCAFCHEKPTGAEGHAGLAQAAYKIPGTERALVRLACVFCGTNWVRQRPRARVYEWLRVAR
jgi:hypothetical protein